MAETIKKKKAKLTPHQEELVKAAKKVKEYKLAAEANVVSILWAERDLYFVYDSLTLNDFSNNIWKVYWEIGKDIVVKEDKILDEITINFYLEKHEKLKEKYENYGGYETISKTNEYISKKNISGYIRELSKWNAVLELLKKGFPVYNKLSKITDMDIEEVYDEYEVMLNHIFINAESEVKSYSLSDGIDGLIDSLNEGMAIGLPYYEMDMLNKDTGGQMLGNITLVGGASNVGKSTFARSITIPTVIKHDEPLVIMLNEEALGKWQRELLVWTANNIFGKDLDGGLQKHTVRDGNYSKEVMDILRKSAEWIKEKDKDKTIRIIPFKKYKTAMAIKIINKYSALGCNYFILDTFKADSGKTSTNTWLEMQQSMVDINDAVKPESKNVHILITVQLNKGSTKQRYYTQDNLSTAKNIIDVASTGIFIRDVYDDEYEGEKRALKVFRMEGKNKRTQIPVHLDKKKTYQIIFIVKSREGAANSYQIVIEHDKSRNTMKEVGLTFVPITDF